MKEKLRRFLAGRYGVDQLNKFLVILAFVLFLMSSIFRNRLYYFLGIVVWGIELYRMMSRNYYKRMDENQLYLNLYGKFKHQLLCLRNNLKDKQHKYYTCPKCYKMVRVPRGKGKISISCPSCSTRFDGKS